MPESWPDPTFCLTLAFKLPAWKKNDDNDDDTISENIFLAMHLLRNIRLGERGNPLFGLNINMCRWTGYCFQVQVLKASTAHLYQNAP